MRCINPRFTYLLTYLLNVVSSFTRKTYYRRITEAKDVYVAVVCSLSSGRQSIMMTVGALLSVREDERPVKRAMIDRRRMHGYIQQLD